MRGASLEGVVLDAGAAVDLGSTRAAAPDEIWLEADEGVAVAHAALDGFEEEGVGPSVGELEHGRDGRVEIGDQRRPDDLRHAAAVGRGEIVESGRRGHEPSEASSTLSLTSTP